MDLNRLDAILDSYKDEMTISLQELVRIPSIQEAPLGGKPFGEGPAKALDYVLEKAEKFGFSTVNDEYYAGHAEYGQGEEIMAFLGHLDVVPLGTGWHYPPFGAEIHDGVMYGRGTTDNKCSCIMSLYVLRAIKEAGIRLNKRVRLIFGCNEETGMEDIPHYVAHIGQPTFGVVPDSGFPVCFSEKGIQRMQFDCDFAGETPVLSITAGEAVNVVPDTCVSEIKGDEETLKAILANAKMLGITANGTLENGVMHITTSGLAAHGSRPQDGVNAVCALLEILKVMNLGAAENAANFLREHLNQTQWDGHGLNIKQENKDSDALTVNLGIIRVDSKHFMAQIDLREPHTADFEQIGANVKASCEPYGLKLTVFRASPALFVDKNDELVVKFQAAYKAVTGRDEQPFAMGGGTYARKLKKAVAFGPSLPDSKSGGAHAPDEHLVLNEWFTAAKIYARTIVLLASDEK